MILSVWDLEPCSILGWETDLHCVALRETGCGASGTFFQTSRGEKQNSKAARAANRFRRMMLERCENRLFMLCVCRSMR